MKNNRKIVWGSLFIFLSLYMIAESFYSFEGPSVFTMGFTVFLVVYAITKLFDRNFVEGFLGIGILGYIHYDYLGFTDGSPWVLIAASVLMGLGLQLIFKKQRKPFTVHFDKGDFNYKSNFKDVVDVEVEIDDHEELKQESNQNTKEKSTQDYIHANTNFSDQKRYIRSDNFTQADLESNFGNLEVYFQGAEFNPSGAVINVEANFGNVTLYLPRTVNVQNNLKAALGSVTGDSSFVSQDAPTVLLQGSANFGKISVRYL